MGVGEGRRPDTNKPVRVGEGRRPDTNKPVGVGEGRGPDTIEPVGVGEFRRPDTNKFPDPKVSVSRPLGSISDEKNFDPQMPPFEEI